LAANVGENSFCFHVVREIKKTKHLQKEADVFRFLHLSHKDKQE